MPVVNRSYVLSNRYISDGLTPTAPLINSVLGTAGDREILTITGINFGPGPVFQNIVYDLFLNAEPGVQHRLAATVGQWDYDNTPAICSSDAHSGTCSAYQIKNDTTYRLKQDIRPFATEAFSSAAYKVPVDNYFPYASAPQTFPSASAWKPFWIFGTGGSGDNDLVFFTYSGASFDIGGNDPGMPGLSIAGGAAGNFQFDDWNRFTAWLRADPTNPDTVNGVHWAQTIKEGVSQQQYEKLTVPVFGGVSPYRWATARYGGWHRYSGSSLVNMLIDSAYFAYGPGAASRFEIGDNQVYANCTRLMICEPILNQWSPTSVKIRLHKGSHAAISGTYLFAINNDNVPCNLGYPL